MSAPVLEVSNLSARYGKVGALVGASLTVPAGSIVTVIGANGAGKSTLLAALRAVLSLENGEVSAGSIRFGGRDVSSLRPHELVRSGLFHVMEGRRIFEDLTVDENLVAATYARTGSAAARFDLVYEYFPNLHTRRTVRAGYLSGGEQQMLAIGRALVAEPQLILLDEPSLGLSPKLVEEIFAIIARINAEQRVSMLLVEQNAAIAFAVASYGYIMESGRIVIDGPVDRLTRDQDVREFYLGLGGEGGAKSYRDVKHYKRRKRWLS